MGQTDLGRLDVGYMADLVVLDGRLDEDELNEIRVLDTFVGGI
jgi:predicted amidohydrolase YtcJ